MILLDKDSIGLYYISRKNLSVIPKNSLYKLLPMSIFDFNKDELSPNTINRINISKNFRLYKDGIIFHKFRIKKLEK